MAGLCKAVLIGNLGKDPEIRYTPDGLAVCNFSLAANEKYKGEDRTEWFRITVFGKLAEICSQYLTKGKQVYIEGKLKTSEWQDRDGNNRFTVEIIANNMVMLGSKGDASAAQRPPATKSYGPNDPAVVARNEAAGPQFGDDTDPGDIPEGDIPF